MWCTHIEPGLPIRLVLLLVNNLLGILGEVDSWRSYVLRENCGDFASGLLNPLENENKTIKSTRLWDNHEKGRSWKVKTYFSTAEALGTFVILKLVETGGSILLLTLRLVITGKNCWSWISVDLHVACENNNSSGTAVRLRNLPTLSPGKLFDRITVVIEL